MAEYTVTVEGQVEAYIIVDAEDEDDALNQAERLFQEHVTFDADGIEVEDLFVTNVEATEALRGEDEEDEDEE